MISGAHVILYTRDAEADRRFVREVLRFPHVDVGHGWLIFALPPAEVAMHPVEGSAEGGTSQTPMQGAPYHELYLMCEDIEAFVAEMKSRSIACSGVHEQPWGRLVTITLPSGTELGVYEPKHASPKWKASRPAKRKPAPKKKAKPARAAKKNRGKRR